MSVPLVAPDGGVVVLVPIEDEPVAPLGDVVVVLGEVVVVLVLGDVVVLVLGEVVVLEPGVVVVVVLGVVVLLGVVAVPEPIVLLLPGTVDGPDSVVLLDGDVDVPLPDVCATTNPAAAARARAATTALLRGVLISETSIAES